ncbi:hypothetical protein BDN72DRAFT_760833, partial [Pluteus cervinus]
FWDELRILRNIWNGWSKGVNELDARIQSTPTNLLRRAKLALNHIPWTGHLLGFPNSTELHHLCTYLTDGWLTDEHELVMLDLLKDDLKNEGQEHILIEDPHFTSLLTTAYHERDRYPVESTFKWIRDHGTQLAQGKKTHLATIANLNNRHWVSYILDFTEQSVWYADSMGNQIPDELRTVLLWWIGVHTGRHFIFLELPVSIQLDGYSCGILSWDALRYKLSLSCARLTPASEALDERVAVFLRLIKYYRVSKSDSL